VIDRRCQLGIGLPEVARE